MGMGKGVGMLAAEAVTDRVAERVESPLTGVVSGRVDMGMGMAAALAQVIVQRLCNLGETVHLLEHVLHALSVPHGVEVHSTDACVVVVVVGSVVLGVEGVVEHGK